MALGATGIADREPANRECGCVEACGTRTRACGAQTTAAAALGSGAVGSVEAKGKKRPGIPCGQKTVVRGARRHLITATTRGVLGGCCVLSNRAAVQSPGNCLHKVLGHAELKTSVEDVKK